MSQLLRSAPYFPVAMEEFAVRDHDGYVLGFGESRGGPDHRDR
jgi:hypothetical protein